jgi:hypothetical protein
MSSSIAANLSYTGSEVKGTDWFETFVPEDTRIAAKEKSYSFLSDSFSSHMDFAVLLSRLMENIRICGRFIL